MSFWGGPLKPYAANRFTFTDFISTEQYAKHTKEITDRLLFNASTDVIGNMTRMQASVYIFSEKELKELLTSVKQGAKLNLPTR